MLNDDDRRAVIQKRLKNPHEHLHVQRVQADGRLVEHEHGVRLRAPDFAGQLQALRFSARLDFSIEEATLAAIEKKAHLATALAAERIRDEVEKTLLTPRPETVGLMLRLGLLDDFLFLLHIALQEDQKHPNP